ncbi:hypothetical protein KCP77_04050 [Salmonella enterica subsp. enterica]|nr:hypothetical protein KCP77_04050 [Salmonella enterica subsp. enterica]
MAETDALTRKCTNHGNLAAKSHTAGFCTGAADRNGNLYIGTSTEEAFMTNSDNERSSSVCSVFGGRIPFPQTLRRCELAEGNVIGD